MENKKIRSFTDLITWKEGHKKDFQGKAKKKKANSIIWL